jgi:uncharacterized membrane protein
MSLAPLLNANPTIQAHAFAAVGVFAFAVVEPAVPNDGKTTLARSLDRDVAAWPAIRDDTHD